MGLTRSTRRASRDELPGLPWHDWWLRMQVNQQPPKLYACVRNFDEKSRDDSFAKINYLYSKVSTIITNGTALSIDNVVQALLDDSIIVAEDIQGLESVTYLVFSMIGWQTMLYRPDMFSCPPSQFSIADEMDGHSSESHICLKQSRKGSSKQLSDFLLGFGLMLPPRNYHALDDAEDIKTFNRLKSVDSSTLNIHLLTTIGSVTVHWSDCLACHLELDKDSRILYMFRYPSFCMESLRNRTAENNGRSVIHSCASDIPSHSHWATHQDVTELHEEVVLSYRLLFGQHLKSRKLFRHLRPFEHIPSNGRDVFLSDLCERKELDPSLGIGERDSYELARDFAHLRTRLVRLSTYLDERKPRSWKELWLDNRDSASWLTFWAVIIIGGMGIFLAFIQVVLQVVQIAMGARQADS